MQIFFRPAVLAIASLSGLVLGLTGDGWRDALAIILLLLPIVAIAVSWGRRS